MKKRISILLAVLFILLIPASCATKTTESQPTGGQQTTTSATSTEQTTASAPIKLQWISPGNIQEFTEGATANDNIIVNYWEEKSGYDLDVIVLPLDGEADKLNIMFNSGEATGIAWIRSRDFISTLVNQKLIVPLDEYVDSSIAFQKYETMQRAGQFDGKQYALVPPEDGASSQGIPLLVRKDILVENGMTTPPKTYEEFMDALDIFKDAGMIPYVAAGSITGRGFNVFQSLFGIQNERAIRDDSVVLPKLLPEAKDYISFMSELYRDGYIPKDYQVIKDQDAIQLYVSGQAGMISFAWPWAARTIVEKSEELGYETAFLDFPSNIKGEKGHCAPIPASAPWYGVISSKCEDPKAAMDFIDFLTQDDVRLITYFGIEGEHFDLVNGKPVPSAGAKDIAWGTYFRAMIETSDWFYIYGLGEGLAEYYYPSERNTVGSPDVEPFRYVLVPAEVSQTIRDLNTQMLLPFYDNVVIGEESIDGFDPMVNEYMSSGGADALAKLQKLWEDAGKPRDVIKSALPEDQNVYTGKYIWK